MNFLQCGITLDCFEKAGSFLLTMNFVRYYPIAGLAFLIFWVLGKKAFALRRVQDSFPEAERIWYEIKYSFGTLVIFTGIGLFSVYLRHFGLTKVYVDLDKYGTWYMIGSFVLLTVWHETWFYWAHRAMHSKLLFKHVHLVHHRSINPTPFAAYSFHPIEAVLEGLYLLIFTMVIPSYRYMVLFHTFYAMLLNIYFHTGYEFFPKNFLRGRITKWINTSTHHNMHHSKTHGNYSLYFNFWDRILGTNHPEYQKTFEEIAGRAADASGGSPSRRPRSGHGVGKEAQAT